MKRISNEEEYTDIINRAELSRNGKLHITFLSKQEVEYLLAYLK